MTTAYQGTIGVTFAPRPVAKPLDQDQSGGSQQAASQAVIGSDAAVTTTLPFQGIGSSAAPATGAFTAWDGTIP
jgi:hypothetical protein